MSDYNTLMPNRFPFDARDARFIAGADDDIRIRHFARQVGKIDDDGLSMRRQHLYVISANTF